MGSRPLVIGREAPGGIRLADNLVSRRHVQVSHEDGRFAVGDLGSRNGTFVDGHRVTSGRFEGTCVLRVGHALFLLSQDAAQLATRSVKVEDGLVVGPTLADALDRVAQAARSSETLLVTGETGSGKEIAARVFHQKSPRASGPFVAVNCAAIPEGVAERLLFGTKRGTYSGAHADADGYLQSASDGTLFLDELGELDPAVQAKLLRVIETRTVLPLGATRAQPVSLGICAATNADLAAAVASDDFREDLYFRICRPEIRVPPLRERREEIPWLVREVVARISGKLAPHSLLVETCLLRSWPGNVRELISDVSRAAHAALEAGRSTVRAQDLPEPALSGPSHGMKSAAGIDPQLARRTVEEESGNVSAAARRLGLHRTQLRRLLKKIEL
jgi:transcriptional regulator with PAS, ATPase and Fis domain